MGDATCALHTHSAYNENGEILKIAWEIKSTVEVVEIVLINYLLMKFVYIFR